MGKQSQEEAKVTLRDFYIEQKVTCFCDTYNDCESERDADEAYNCARLRKYFEAYAVPGLGDLLSEYLSELQSRGFVFRTSIAGEPAIFVKLKHAPSSVSLLIE